MYNFDETKSLSELKELCFYIKAINESGYREKWSENTGKIINYLKSEYNLEVSASKLYLFVQKILYVVKSDSEFPTTEKLDSIISEFIKHIRKKQRESKEELTKAELNFEDPKYDLSKDNYSSSKELSTNIHVKEKIYANHMTKIVVWSLLIGLFTCSLACCIIGTVFPNLFMVFISRPQELAIIVLFFCVITMLAYLILYLVNRKTIYALSLVIKRYYRYEALIKLDENRLKEAKHNLFVANNLVSVNGIELSNDMLTSYLQTSDSIDISYFGQKLKNDYDNKQNEQFQYAKIGQTISNREQDHNWRNSEDAIKEKQYINREIVERINILAETIRGKRLEDETVAHSISEFYCNELSVDARTEKINNANSKIELLKNYVELIDKINEYENMSIFDINKMTAKLKSVMVVSMEERLSFEKSLSTMISRIEKANALGLLSKGQVKTCKNVQNDLHAGIVQGMQLNLVNLRYDLAKLYIKLYEELALFDILN